MIRPCCDNNSYRKVEPVSPINKANNNKKETYNKGQQNNKNIEAKVKVSDKPRFQILDKTIG